jgi:hypothetical protein
MTALLGSAALTGERAQTAVTHLFVTVAFRFVRPPAVRAAMVSHCQRAATAFWLRH